MCTSNFLLVLLIVLGTCIDLKCGLKILISVHSCFFQGRNYSESQQPKNFFQKFFEQVQEDLKKNKEIKVIFFRHKSLLVILSKKNIIYIFYWINGHILSSHINLHNSIHLKQFSKSIFWRRLKCSIGNNWNEKELICVIVKYHWHNSNYYLININL